MKANTNSKRKGEVGELAFACEAMRRGLKVFEPYGDSAPYDFIIDGPVGLLRVQVRSVWQKSRFYQIGCARTARRKAYNHKQIDVIAAYIAPEKLWYLVPVEAVAKRTAIYVWPHSKNSRGLWEKYRERWELLGRAPLPLDQRLGPVARGGKRRPDPARRRRAACAGLFSSVPSGLGSRKSRKNLGHFRLEAFLVFGAREWCHVKGNV